MSPPTDRYTHGHHESVLRSHSWRTAENSAAFVLEHLRPGDSVLDVGCGPGTITIDLARLVAPGATIGIDLSADVIETARANGAASGVDGLHFDVGNVYALTFDDATFDVVFAHQILQHLAEPVAALVDLRRVLRPGGLLAARDADFGAFAWYPLDERLSRWMELYHQITRVNSAQADAGRRLVSWARRAGFDVEVASSSNWTFHTLEERQWWGQLWADRVRHSEFAVQGVEYGLTTPGELQSIAEAFIDWAASDDGVFIVVHGEIVARA
jgi:ubiquinone/menaquinone biosynthesis C-methylase UbiE